VRKWADNQMKDSRFMYLPADLARLLICYVRDAAVAEHCTKPIEVAKTLIWEEEKPEIRNCKCGAVIVVSGYDNYGGNSCSRYKCETYECNKCMKHCDSCSWAECTEHIATTTMEMHICEVCKSKNCHNCYVEQEDCICSRCGRRLCSECVEYIPTEGNAMICDQVYGCIVTP
jgi:hypothetical protein